MTRSPEAWSVALPRTICQTPVVAVVQITTGAFPMVSWARWARSLATTRSVDACLPPRPRPPLHANHPPLGPGAGLEAGAARDGRGCGGGGDELEKS